MKTKKIILYTIIIILLLGITYLLLNNNKYNLIKLDYKEITNKVDNKDSFVLCISKTDCSHCANYKPKLKKVAQKYNINLYYIDVDTLNENDLNEFKTKFSFDGSTPTTLFIKDGEEKTTATRISGDVPVERIVDKLEKNGFIK